MRRMLPACLACLTTVLVGCAGTINSSVQLGAGDAAHISVEGDSPVVQLENTGPDAVWVDVRVPAQGTTEGAELVPGSVLSRSVSQGPIEIDVRTEGQSQATIDIEAKRATGFSVSKGRPKAK